ncbi:hypothetical protein [Amycolatopsis sp. cmx-4-61]|uniref:hypothetical protein n=1 Tax=Amycolatopsis sp. cmx-4-61 TaxID=2790937 RepID=UPI00397BB238
MSRPRTTAAAEGKPFADPAEAAPHRAAGNSGAAETTASEPTTDPSSAESVAASENEGPASALATPAASEPAALGGGAAEGGATTEHFPATATEPAAESGDATGSKPTAAANEATETDPAEAEPAEARPAWRRLPALLLAATLVLTGAGVWFTFEARSAADNPAAANRALTDVGATADVTSAVTLAVNRIFSYSYDRTDVTEKAAAAVLRGPAKDSYDKLFAEVRRKAPEQKLVLTSRVSAIAVQELDNGHARLLVFLDQSAVRADNNATDTAAAQLSVTAERTNGGWVITGLEPR